jgi:hypothetical protein
MTDDAMPVLINSTTRDELYDALAALCEVVESAINTGLFKSVDGNPPDLQALRVARTALSNAADEIA